MIAPVEVPPIRSNQFPRVESGPFRSRSNVSISARNAREIAPRTPPPSSASNRFGPGPNRCWSRLNYNDSGGRSILHLITREVRPPGKTSVWPWRFPPRPRSGSPASGFSRHSDRRSGRPSLIHDIALIRSEVQSTLQAVRSSRQSHERPGPVCIAASSASQRPAGCAFISEAYVEQRLMEQKGRHSETA